MRGASGQAQKLCPKDLVGYSYIIQSEWGSEKTPFNNSFNNSSLVSSKVCIQISRGVVLKLLPLV